MRVSNVIIAVSVVIGGLLGLLVGLLLHQERTGAAVGALAGLAVAFGITGVLMTPARPRQN